MDQDRARSLLLAERDEVHHLLKDAEAAGLQAREAPDVSPLLADGRDASGHDIVHLRFFDPGPPDQVVQSACQQVDGMDPVQRPILFPAADRRAYGLYDVNLTSHALDVNADSPQAVPDGLAEIQPFAAQVRHRGLRAR